MAEKSTIHQTAINIVYGKILLGNTEKLFVFKLIKGNSLKKNAYKIFRTILRKKSKDTLIKVNQKN